MAETTENVGRSAQGWINYVLGLLVFLLGIALMLAAFYWGYAMLKGVDTEIRAVQMVAAAPNPAAAPSGKPGHKPPPVVQTAPALAGNPSLLQFALAAVLKLVLLLVLAAIGAMTASRGARLARITV
jgi:flagellar basal body-associated protein FliL